MSNSTPESSWAIEALRKLGAMPRMRQVLVGFVLFYVAAIIAAWVLIEHEGDRFWLATVLIFGPRWVLLTPALVLLPATLLLRRFAWLGVVIAAALLVLGPAMGFQANPEGLRSPDRPRGVRIMTHNLGTLEATEPSFMKVVDELHPDVVVTQECRIGDEEVFEVPGWFTDTDEGLCLMSRFPITLIDSRNRRDVWDRNGSGAIVHYELETPSGPLALLSVHLETVRDGLQALRWRNLGGLRENTELRAWESELARGWANRSKAPLLIAGDFNMPVESAIYRRYWSGYHNAFSEAGFGYGHTKQTRWFGIRIDHILSDDGWRCERAWLGPETGSDHVPLVADCVRVR